MNRNRFRRIVLTSAGGGIAPYVPSPAAASWKADIIANGGTISDAVLQVFDEQFFIPAVANGNILTEADFIHIWITNSDNVAARTSVEGNNHLASFIDDVLLIDAGIASDGVSSYVDLNYNPAIDGVKLQKDDMSMGYMVNQPPFTDTVRAMGCCSISSSVRRLEVYELSGQSFVFANSTNFSANTNDVSTFDVLMAVKREDAANQIAIINTSEVSAVNASEGIPSNNMFELTSNNNGTPFTDFDTRPHLFSWAGSSNFDYVACATLVSNLKIALAGL